jgi:carboxyl-terminal processing protease
MQFISPFRVSILIFTLTFSQISLFAQDKTKVETVQKFDEVLTYISKLYVDTVNEKSLTEAAIIGMLEKLDPHSTYISKDEVNDANQKINGNFVGIGVRFQILKDTLMIVATIPGGPSEKLGIRAGDKIVKIEGENIAGVGLKNSQVRERLMGDLGTKVKIEIRRKNEKKPLDFVITRANIPVNSVDCHYMLTPQTGYIKLNSFSRTTMDEFKASLKDLKQQGMKNLILDLQDNGGGLLHTSKDLVDEFLGANKLIVYSEGKSQPRQDMYATAKGSFENGRLVILTNENSASASEIVSGAIQDWDRGLIVGRRTYGKGLVQRPIDLSDGSQIRLTIARYFTPSGRFIQKPYDDLDAYKNDYMDRYLRGELSNQDSIKFPDSLKHTTKLSKRTVYGGGGIMPDIFVPIDTMDITSFYKSISRAGHFGNFALTFVDKNREDLMKKYPTFDEFDKNFNCDKKFMKEFFDYVKKEQEDFKHDDKEFEQSEKLIKLRIKAHVAQDLWGITEFYKIFNARNEIIQAGLKAIEGANFAEYKLEFVE